MRPLNLLLILALAPALSGCILFETKAQRAMVKNPQFQAGYSDGCASANRRGTDFYGDKIQDDAPWVPVFNEERYTLHTPRIAGDPSLFVDPVHIPINYNAVYATDAQ